MGEEEEMLRAAQAHLRSFENKNELKLRNINVRKKNNKDLLKNEKSLGNVQKGSGDKAVGVGLDSMSVQSATSAPKAVSEGVPISARTGATAAQDQTEVAGATYDDEEAEADDE